MSEVEIKRNFNLDIEIDNAIGAINYDEVALRAIQIILDKTASGVDYQNQPFTEYSNFYREQRSDKGLPTRPDLFLTGNMLSSIVASSDNNGATISFLDSDSRSKAYAHVTGSGNLPVRDFFFLNEDDADDLLQVAMSFFDDAL